MLSLFKNRSKRKESFRL